MGREARGYLFFSLLFAVVLEALLIVAVIWWPSFRENADAMRRLSAPLPMLRDMVEQIEEFGVAAYIVGQHFFKACNTLGVAAAVLFAMGAIAGEAQRGTLELWLARPVTRTRLYTERYFAGQAAIALPILLTSLSAPLLLDADVEGALSFVDLVLCSAQQALFLGCIYSATFALSAAGSEPLKIAFVMLFVTIFEFATYMVKTISDYSIFRLVDIETYMRVVESDRLDPVLCLPLLAVNASCYGVGLAVFRRRVV
jgi:ABC-type transport system involved in multi-copper enzyme maturation permease subunit